jgi:predicted metal-dependent enzyme (double-stranded beta helix superfamily)
MAVMPIDRLRHFIQAMTKDAERYQQYLLHCDPLERFSVVSFVWGPGQKTPVHDHTVWSLVGAPRGAEYSQEFEKRSDGLAAGRRVRLVKGDIEELHPDQGDIHRVFNAYADRRSISIDVYDATIGAVRRHVFEPETGVD